jgi:PPOX class probable F420-dependent enzyme
MTKAADKELSGYFATLSASKYMLLTTFRRDGRAVATPVHVVAEPDMVFFRTWDVSGKAKRLGHTPMVEVAPCSFRGRSQGRPCLRGPSCSTGKLPSRPPERWPKATPSCTAV